MRNRFAAIVAVLVLVVCFFAVNILSGALFPSARLDLTQQKLYTISDGSKRIVRSLDDPIDLTFFYSAKLAQGNPGLQAYGTRIRDLLEEYARLSRGGGKGRLNLTVVDPEPLSDAEDRAAQAGLTGVPLDQRRADNFYMGLLGTNRVEGREVIPFLDPGRERFLEYDVTKLIYTLAHPEKKTVGVISSLPLDGGFSMDPRTRQPKQTPPWLISQEIKGLFEWKMLETTIQEVPKEVDVLMVVHPKNLGDATLYAIDQFVMRGGRLLAFVDPMCEDDPASQGEQMQAMMADKSSNLDKLLTPWGVEVAPKTVATDSTFALPVNTGSRNKPDPVSFVAWLGLDKSKDAGAFAKDDAVTGQLSRLVIASAGIIREKGAAKPEEKKDDKKDEKSEAPAPSTEPRLTITPLIQTSEKSMELDSQRLQFMPDPKQLLSTFAAGNKRLTLAARLTGRVKSAFAGGRPAPPADAKEPPKPLLFEHLAESKGEVSAILVADADMLANRWWAQETILGVMKGADNGDFVVNAIDNLTGSSDLMKVRARGEYARPFTVVEEMEKRAEQSYRSEQSVLQQKLQQAEQRLAELERQKPEGADAKASFILTPEQQAEIKKFQAEKITTRKQLREVGFNLKKDIDRLGTMLKFINIGVVPALVALAAVLLGAYRVARRGSARRTVAQAE